MPINKVESLYEPTTIAFKELVHIHVIELMMGLLPSGSHEWDSVSMWKAK